MSQILAMAKRLQETEQTIAELRVALHEAREANLTQHVFPMERHIPNTPSVDTSFDSSSHAEASSTTQVTPGSDMAPEQVLLSDLSLDENGKLCYYGPTSAVHAPPPAESTNINDSHSSMSDARSLLTSAALESRTWEEFALGNAAIQTDIPRQMISKLLQIHWTWIAPMFNWVYRPAFMPSDSIEKLLLLFERSFGFTRITYLMSYCIYTAASVLMQDVKKGDFDAQVKIQTFLQALRQGTRACPVVQRSLHIITNSLRADATNVPDAKLACAPTGQTPLARNYLPAFPYPDLDVGYSTNLNRGSTDLDGSTLLDCFPETQYGVMDSGGECFFPTA
ncbi:hypothetical protein APSETT445_005775 [Aspergillus pseudonomiae]